MNDPVMTWGTLILLGVWVCIFLAPMLFGFERVKRRTKGDDDGIA